LETYGLTFDTDGISDLVTKSFSDIRVTTSLTGTATDSTSEVFKKIRGKILTKTKTKNGEVIFSYTKPSTATKNVNQKADAIHTISDLKGKLAEIKVTNKFRGLYSRNTFEFQTSSINRILPSMLKGVPNGRTLGNEILFTVINSTKGAIFQKRKRSIQQFLSKMMLNTIVDIKDLDQNNENIIWLINLNEKHYPLSSLIGAILKVRNFLRVTIDGDAEIFHRHMEPGGKLRGRFNILGRTMVSETELTPYITKTSVANIMAKNA
jgi:hypothetical protein